MNRRHRGDLDVDAVVERGSQFVSICDPIDIVRNVNRGAEFVVRGDQSRGGSPRVEAGAPAPLRVRQASVEPRAPLGHLADGTPYYAQMGELAFADDRSQVCCHLCGNWFRALAPSHLGCKHGWEHAHYKAEFGLTKSTALQVPELRQLHRAVITRLLETDHRVSDALIQAQNRMRDNPTATSLRHHARGPQRLAHQRSSRVAAARASHARQLRSETARLHSVHSLGFPTVEAYLRTRYVEQHNSLAMIAQELGAGLQTLRRLLAECHITIRSKTRATEDTRRRRSLEDLLSGLGPDGQEWVTYLGSRVRAGASLALIAGECGRSRAWVRRAQRILEIV